MNDFICHSGTSCPLVFQLHNTSVLSLHHVYCAVLSSSPWVLFLFQVLHHGSLASLSFLSSSYTSSLSLSTAILSLLHCNVTLLSEPLVDSSDLIHFGMILTHLAWIAERLDGTLAK